MFAVRKLTREVIEVNTVELYRTASGTRPDLRVVKLGDDVLVVKDFKRSDLLFRLLVGPILVRREIGALMKLSGVEGVPRFAGRVDRYAFAVEHVCGASLESVRPGTLGKEFYVKLRQLLDEIHARGVAHCDLRSRGNVMVTEDGRPYVVDFAASVCLGRGVNPFTRWLFGQFVLADNNAVLLLKQRLSRELLTDEENAELAVPLPYERPAKFVGERVRWLSRRLLTRRGP